MAKTNDGLASARARGRVGGRRPKLTADQAELAQQLYDAREKTVQQIADMFNVPRSTVYGHLAKTKTVPASRRRPPRRSLESHPRVTCSLVSELGLQARDAVIVSGLHQEGCGQMACWARREPSPSSASDVSGR